MSTMTPRRPARIAHQHTPKMSERKKGLFQSDSETSRESMTKHRQLKVLESESESDDCDLGIMGTLDSSSCDENDSINKTPERNDWREHVNTRSQSKKWLKENQDLKNFIKSPFTLKKYQTRYSCPESKNSGSMSTPVTPHLQNRPKTPSSTHSCASAHTTSSTSSKARKSLANLIADTESCSSSLKDLNFDSDSGTDSKENTPSKSLRRSNRRHKMTPKLQSFKGILMEQKKNWSPIKNPVVCLTKMDISSVISPTQMLKTPHNTSETIMSPPKLGPNRRSILQIDESPESICDSEKSHKRLNYDNKSDHGPSSKHPRLDPTTAPKARLSLFNSDRLKEILSTKSFYGKSNPDINTTVATKLSHAIEATQSYRRHLFPPSHSSKRKRKPGQINLGVRHRIRKPKIQKKIVNQKANTSLNGTNNSVLYSTVSSGFNNTLESQNISLNTSQELDKADPFDKEKQTIDALLSQWTEEETEGEVNYRPRSELPCFNSSIIEETSQIFQPVQAVPVSVQNIPQDSEAVIVELGASKSIPNVEEVEFKIAELHKGAQDVMMSEPGHKESHGEIPKGDFLPVEGGFIVVEENATPVQEDLPDLDEIERELKMLDEQILKMAKSNNIDAESILASTAEPTSSTQLDNTTEKSNKLFPIFNKPNPGNCAPDTPSTQGTADKNKKPMLKTGRDQYVIDAGQKRFGATQCNECGVIYQIGDPQDEHDHLVHHNATDVLKFNGLKDECVVGRSNTARCIRIRGGEAGWRKVETLLERVVHPQLGYAATLLRNRVETYTAYLYIDKKQIVGFLLVEPKLRANKLIPGEPDCCSVEEYPVKCGVSRVWTHAGYRRRGVASRLLDCARASFLYGAALRRDHVAFSAPTAAGRALAAHYCNTPHFYVYMD